MSYTNLQACVADLERTDRLRRIADVEIDPYLELASIQRRAYRKGGPALLFTRVKGTRFPMLANLFGTMERTRFIFRKSLKAVELLLSARQDPVAALRRPWRYARTPLTLVSMLPKKVRKGPVLDGMCSIGDLPQLVSWREDGGPFITLPQAYSEHPGAPGFFNSNLGMYRIQLGGNEYIADREVGFHYHIHRGIGPHHAAALARGEDLAVNVFVGGPPAMTMAAIMPLPEGVPEICFAGALAGSRMPMIMPGPESAFSLPIAAEADFCLCGRLIGQRGEAVLKKEGPFGDHLGYYSLAHDFPVMRVDRVYHRKDAIWPFTSVGRPPQEDTVFGDFIHELTATLVPNVFSGIHEVHAVDAAGVHPLLLALGSERYVPFSRRRMPQELLTGGLALLGNTQTSLAKYLLIAAREDSTSLSTRNIPDFFSHMLYRTDFSRDLHFITRATMDTLDYSGSSLNEGSKLLWAAAGEPLRRLAVEMPELCSLPEGFGDVLLFAPGIVVCRGPKHNAPRGGQDAAMHSLAERLGGCLSARDNPQASTPLALLDPEIALIVVVDDAKFTCASWDNFLWTAFTRSDPATDIYGVREFIHSKHWGCTGPLIMDSRMKAFHAPPLEEDPEVEKRIDEWGARGGPLHGLI